jgi:hypothetical protein
LEEQPEEILEEQPEEILEEQPEEILERSCLLGQSFRRVIK